MKVLIGDLFESEAQTLVNTVNCVGVMGRGVALQFKQHFPDMYQDYVKRCELRQVRLGEPYLYRRTALPWILNFPTKDHWKSVSKLSDIVKGLGFLKNHYKKWNITSLAVPPLGCGQGQLQWRIVGPTLYQQFNEFDIPVELFAPYGTPHSELEPEFLSGGGSTISTVTPATKADPSALALVEILARIEQEPYHWPVGRVLFQKLAYFATEAGISTGLQYKRGSFGPYADELKKLTTRLVNNGLIQEQRLGRMFAVRVGPTYKDARTTLEMSLRTLEPSIERVTDLIVRMRTDQAEIAATVLFVAGELELNGTALPTESDVLMGVMDWKSRRKPPFKRTDVAASIRSLAILGWLNVKPTFDLAAQGDARNYA